MHEAGSKPADDVIWCGSYTSPGWGIGQGVVALRPRADGSLRNMGVAAWTDDPSRLLVHPADPSRIFAVSESLASVCQFRREGEFTMTKLKERATSGHSPCHLEIGESASGATLLYAACYGDGSVSVHSVSADGSFGGGDLVIPPAPGSGPDPSQDGPHAHAVASVAGCLVVADLGTDSLRVLRWTEGGLAEEDPVKFPPGTGPRDILVHPSGLIWVLGEHGLTIHVLRIAADGAAVIGSSPVAAQLEAHDKAAGISLTDDGRFAYVGLRGSNRIAVMAASPDGATLSAIGTIASGGDWPRHHLLRGEMLHVANERSHSVATFRIDTCTGMPSLVGTPEPVGSPTHLLPALGSR